MDFIRELHLKYMSIEDDIDKKLEKIKIDEEKLQKQSDKLLEMPAQMQSKILCYDDALLRNSNILKTLEMVKARLRSRSTFSPMEQLLLNAVNNYNFVLEGYQP